MIVTIDGSAGTGKTTVAKKVAEKLGLPFFDTGAMYRSVAWAILHAGIDLSDQEAIERLLKEFSYTIRLENGEKRYYVGHHDVTLEIRSQKINAIVSEVAAMPAVRRNLWDLQRAYAARQSAVFEGRDMGSAVFPDADLKIFLTADPAVRAERRLSETQTKLPQEAQGWDRQKMMEELARRDRIDSGRALAPLTRPEGAVEIDTSHLSIDEVVEKVLEAYKKMHKRYVRKYSPAWLKGKGMRFIYRVVLCGAWLYFKLFHRHRIYGLEHFFKGAAIIAPNHTSYLDPPIVSLSWPEEVHFLARDYLFKPPVFGSFIRALNSHPVQGDVGDISVFKTILGLLGEGKKIILFPEGHRTGGQIEQIKPGIGLLLSRSKASVVPVYVHGAFEIWGRHRKLPKLFGKTVCIFGSPIHWERFAEMDKRKAQQAVADEISKALHALKDWYEKGAEGIPP